MMETIFLQAWPTDAMYAYVREGRPELTPGTQLSHVKLTTRKQDTVVFCVLESYEVYQRGQQAA